MTDLERIKQSTNLQMELSEMLFKALELGCWHERKWATWICEYCNIKLNSLENEDNPNLFADWTGFGVVWEAVKDRDDLQKEFGRLNRPIHLVMRLTIGNYLMFEAIATPHFQLEVLKWLVGADTVEKVVKGGKKDG